MSKCILSLKEITIAYWISNSLLNFFKIICKKIKNFNQQLWIKETIYSDELKKIILTFHLENNFCFCIFSIIKKDYNFSWNYTLKSEINQIVKKEKYFEREYRINNEIKYDEKPIFFQCDEEEINPNLNDKFFLIIRRDFEDLLINANININNFNKSKIDLIFARILFKMV